MFLKLQNLCSVYKEESLINRIDYLTGIKFKLFCSVNILHTIVKWSEPRGISSLSSMIVLVSVVLKRTVDDSD